MKTSHKTVIAALAVSVALNIGLIYTAVNGKSNIKYSHARIGNIYEQNLHSLNVKCSELEHSLAKLKVSTDNSQSVRILSDIIDDSSAASASLTALPISAEYTAVLNRYFNHLSDYSRYMLYNAINSELLSQEYADNISAMHSCALSLSQAFTNYDNGSSSSHDWSLYMDKEISELDMLSDTLFSTLEAIQTESIDYPTLIYDGPFSDNVINKVVNEDNSPITQQQAVEILAEFMMLSSSYELKNITLCEGIITAYNITLQSNGIMYYGSVAKNSGKVISFLCDNEAATGRHPRDKAIQIAQRFLSSNGYNSMEPQYCEETKGIATINFVYKQDNILIYPDMVKVRVNLSNGTVEGFEGFNYYANHRQRSISTVSADVPDNLLPQGCSVERKTLAVIPTDGENEQLCLEVRCTVNEDTFILYFDVVSNREIKIFKVIHTENGDFTV